MNKSHKQIQIIVANPITKEDAKKKIEEIEQAIKVLYGDDNK